MRLIPFSATILFYSTEKATGGEGPMRRTEEVVSWVVYKMTIRGNPDGMNAVCEQGEWDAMELAQPGHNTLVRAGIPNEGEAERLARGKSGDPKVRGLRR